MRISIRMEHDWIMPHLAFLLVLITQVLGAKSPESSVHEVCRDSVENVSKDTFDSDQKRAKAVKDAYARHCDPILRPRDLSAASGESLKLDFEAAYYWEFFSHDRRAVTAMARIFKQLEKLGIASQRNTTDLFQSMIDVRDFRAARDFYAARKKDNRLPALPEINGVAHSKGTIFVVDPRQRKLDQRPVDLSEIRILVVASPLCHFSQNAAEAIETDPELRNLFKDSLWISPQADQIARDFDLYQTWNSDHPDIPINFVYQQWEWPIEKWNTPSFNFVRNGKVVKRVFGWGPMGEKDKLLAAWQEVGNLRY